MTLIAIRTTPKRVQIMTDTWSYQGAAQTLGSTSKVTLFPHLNAATLTQGSCEVSDRWATYLRHAATNSDSFDDFLVNHAQASIAHAWNDSLDALTQQNEAEETDHDLADTTAFVVGYSDHDQRYVAVAFPSAMDFLPVALEDTFVIPSPLDVAPPALELMRTEKHLHTRATGGTYLTTADAVAMHTWQQHPPLVPPSTDKDWRHLAERVRHQRAMAPDAWKVLVGGTAWLTTMTPGHQTHRAIHTFNDTPDELAKVFAGTLHPTGQLGPCVCNSGDRYLDCCLTQYLDQSCTCGSTRTLRQCCAVPVARTRVGA